MSMRIGIIGFGPSGAYAALKIKDLRKDFDVEIIDKETKALKKLRATGNGHCNLLPEEIHKENYSSTPLLNDLNSLKPLLEQFEQWGIPLTHIEGQGYYPLSYSAPSFSELLINLLEQRGVKFSLGTRVLDYSSKGDGVVVKTDKGQRTFDHLIIASGGKSHSELGSDGSLFEVLKKHSVSIIEPKPALTPLLLKDNDIKGLDGIRHHAKVSLMEKNRVVYEEEGEILYRKKGISGIVIFNIEREWAKRGSSNGYLKVDLFPNLQKEALDAEIEKFKALSQGILLQGFFVEPLRNHILRRHETNKNRSLAHTIKNLIYEIEGDDGFSNSQVTVGGVETSQLDDAFRFKTEPNISAIGEVVDIDAKCGGNNLAYCLYSAIKAATGLAKK